MAKNEKVYFTKDLRFKPTQFTPADGIDAKMIFNPSAEGSRVDGIAITSTAATQKILLLSVNNLNTGDICKLGHITVPGNSGLGAASVVSGLNRGNLPWLKIDSNGNPYINMNFNMNLEIQLAEALGVGEVIDISVFGANYDA